MSIRRQRGLSLIELIIFMVVMGIAAAAVLMVMNLSSRNSADPVRRKQALLIAEAYMEEIQLARFTYCDPTDANALTATSPADCALASLQEQMGPAEGGNARPYDNVNDYAGAGANMVDASGRLLDASGAPLGATALSGYTATVTVAPPTDALGPANLTPDRRISGTATPANMNILRITVTVNYGTGANDLVTLDGYRTRYAPRSIP